MRETLIGAAAIVLLCGPAWAVSGEGSGMTEKEACAAAIKDARSKPGGKDFKAWTYRTAGGPLSQTKSITVKCWATSK